MLYTLKHGKGGRENPSQCKAMNFSFAKRGIDDVDNGLAMAGHLDYCLRKVQKTAVNYPWELGFLKQDKRLFEPPQPIGMVPLAPALDSSSHEDVESSSFAVSKLGHDAFCKMPLIEWERRLLAQRETAIYKWKKIVLLEPMQFEVTRNFWTSVRGGFSTGRLTETLQNVFAGKSTSTLNSRAGPILRYIAFCKRHGRTTFPVSEAGVYEYMLYEESHAAPTYLRSFISSLAFSYHVVGLSGAKCIVESVRVRGLATKCFLNKRKVLPRRPLFAYEILTLEEIVLGEQRKPLADRHVAGCFLFMLYARARFSDMMNVTALSLDTVSVQEEVKGFIETQVGRSKTSFTVERKTRYLPMSATVNGLAEKPWGVAWKEVIEKNAIEVGPNKPLLPARTRNGWHTLPLTAEAGTQWLRTLLQVRGDPPIRCGELGTHSLKTTCLSWLAKWGTDADTRRLMGYHVADRFSTMLIYGRDNTSAGLRELQTTIDAVKVGDFLPDRTRSGMFANALATKEAPGDDAESVSSSSEDSFDEENPQHDELEKAEKTVLDKFDSGVDLSKIPDDVAFFRHCLSRVIHLTEDESGARFRCGRDVASSYTQLDERPSVLIPICKQCFGRFVKGR